MTINWTAGLNAGFNFLGSLVNNLPPLLATLTETAESAFPTAKSGIEKFNFVSTAAQLYLGKVGMQAELIAQLIPLIGQTINTIVSAAKAVPAAALSSPAPVAAPAATP